MSRMDEGRKQVMGIMAEIMASLGNLGTGRFLTC